MWKQHLGLVIVSVFIVGTAAQASSPATTAAIAEMNSAFSGAESAYKKLTDALTADRKSLKPGVRADSLVRDAATVSNALLKAAQASKKIAPNDLNSGEAKSALARLQDIKVTLIYLGYAAKGAFLSPEGKAEGIEGLFETIDRYKAEVETGGPQAKRALNDINNYFNRAKRAYNSLSTEDKISPNGQAFANELRVISAYAQEKAKSWETQQADAATARTKCKEISEQVVRGKHFGYMKDLIRLYKGQKPNRSYSSLNDTVVRDWIARIEDHQEMFKSLAPICSDKSLMDVLSMCASTQGKPRLEAMSPERDPVVWCMMAKEGNQLLLKELEMYVEKDDRRRSSRITPEELERKEGWFSDDRYLTFKEKFFMSEEAKKEAMGEYSAIYDALGAVMNNGSDPFATREESLAKLRAEVERLAPQWRLPPKGASHYGIDLAKKTVQKGFKGSKIKTAAGTDGDWSITKNALGIPLYRSRFGWILFTDPTTSLCQLRTFFISEEYKGGGKYQKDRDITFSKVRWQNCK